ncbi:MAG TPA: hypothetical protein VK991_12835 [Halomonas sp.]|nr:hypothetical protein [Halomonas sp.]
MRMTMMSASACFWPCKPRAVFLWAAFADRGVSLAVMRARHWFNITPGGTLVRLKSTRYQRRALPPIGGTFLLACWPPG